MKTIEIKNIIKLLENQKSSFALLGPGFNNHKTHTFSLLTQVSHEYKISSLEELINADSFIKKESSDNCFILSVLNYELGEVLDTSFSKQKTIDPSYLVSFTNKKNLTITDNLFYLHKEFDSLKKDIEFNAEISYEEYRDQIKKIKKLLKNGDVYQINYTFQLLFKKITHPLHLFFCLYDIQPVPYCALIYHKNKWILSFSPELFLKRQSKNLSTKPMKGTLKRDGRFDHDLKLKNELKSSTKNRAENLMIVDLLRNDLGKISTNIKVKDLFSIEKYSTVFQMTSLIESKVSNQTKFSSIIKALFPCGSITGAPKISAMKNIKSLELKPRGLYTGSIGLINGMHNFTLNVAIRTIEIDPTGFGQMGVGGGIVWDSNHDEEYKEALLKASFIHKYHKPFSLIETMKWDTKNSYYLLNEHLKRLEESAAYLEFHFNKNELIHRLNQLEQKLNPEKEYKIRVLLNRFEGIIIEQSEYSFTLKNNEITISNEHINSQDIYLYHKTTRRDFYNKKRKQCQKLNLFEVVFLNENNELTEGTISNIILKINNQLYTPPIESGLLDGVMRQHLISQNKMCEKILTMTDLKIAESIFVSNSVMGIQEVKINLDKTFDI